MNSDHELNRSAWDELAAAHGQDAYYDSNGLVAGASSLIEEEESAVLSALGADLAGKRVLHLQCHLGFDAITFARRGARVTGVDFSRVALQKARLLGNRCSVTVDWVDADAVQLPRSLDGKFDLVWATMGVLCWIADIAVWMRAVAAALAPNGKLILIDGHPGDSEPLDTISSEFSPTRRLIDSGCDYATAVKTGPQVGFRYSLEAIVEAARIAGLSVSKLLHHTAISCDLCISGVEREPDGRYRRRIDGRPQPVLFTLIAERQQAPGQERHT